MCSMFLLSEFMLLYYILEAMESLPYILGFGMFSFGVIIIVGYSESIN